MTACKQCSEDVTLMRPRPAFCYPARGPKAGRSPKALK